MTLPGSLKPMPARVSSVSGSSLDAGEDQVAAAGRGRRFLEQRGVMALHDGHEPPRTSASNASAPSIAHERGDARELAFALGQDLGLLVVHHLQPVLDRAQEAVGLDQLRRPPRRRSSAAAASAAQRLAGAAGAQRRVAAAQDQLLGLGEELDLADAAAAELHVVARGP